MITTIKFLLRGLLRLLYRVEVSGLEHYHEVGDKALIVANHSSLLDGVLLYAWLPDTPTFAINTQVAERPKFKFFLRFVDLFRMDPTNPLSVKSMIQFINQDNKAVIFPEGRLTTTGSLMKIYEGPGLIADKTGASILPISIDGAQFTPFAGVKDRGHVRWFPKIRIRILAPETIHIDKHVTGHSRRHQAADRMQAIMHKLTFYSVNHQQNLFAALLHSIQRYGKHHEVLEDFTDNRLNYQQLLLKTLVLSRKLRLDTDDGEITGVLLPNTLALPVTFFALTYLGRVPAMLNYTAGLQNIRAALETAQIKTIYTARGFIEKANLEDVIDGLEEDYRIVYLEDLRDQIGLVDKLSGLLSSAFIHKSYPRKISPETAEQPAVVLFTSGSEGTPKGVVLSHKNLLSNYAQIICHLDFNPSDIVFSCLPMFHSFGLNAGFLTPVLTGAKVYIYPTPLHYRIIPEAVYQVSATILFGTNTFFQGYARYANPFDFTSVRYVVGGAEKLRDDTIDLWMNKFGIRIYEGYGVTESSPVISVNTSMHYRRGSVGKPVPMVECQLTPVEGIDQGGRLFVKGPNIMLGYLKHGGQGKVEFPTVEHGAGWYDTGDIADIDDEGYLHILGRAKRFAKLGGEMVSLTLVEEIAMHVWPNHNHAAVSLPDKRKGEKNHTDQ